jgi:hypothetical protein
MAMRSFLERLVARTVEATTVRPRVTARYEQGPWADRASGEVAAVERADDVERTAPSPWPVASAGGRPARDIGRWPAVRDGAATPDHATAPVTAPVPLENREPPPPPVKQVRPPRTPETSRDPGPSPSGPVQAALPPAAIAVPPGVVRPSTSPRLPARLARERPAPPVAPDVVHVRIGRIDVHAMLARPEHPTATAPRTPRARPLSLEAFLDGRRGRP